jgi:hypothetical protein
MTLIDSAFIQADGATLTESKALAVQAGDLLIALCGGASGSISNLKIAESDGVTNLMTLLATSYRATDFFQQVGYVLAASASAEAYFAFSHTENVLYGRMLILQFRAVGKTFAFDAGPSPVGGTDAAEASGQITTTGDDELIIGIHGEWSGATQSALKIGGQDADWSYTGAGPFWTAWYKLFYAPQSNIAASATLSGTDEWLCNIVAFKAVGISPGEVFIMGLDPNVFTDGKYGSDWIANTDAVTGRWSAILVIAAATFSLLTGDVSVNHGAVTGVAFPAGTILRGRFTAITLTSGSVVAYKAEPKAQ